MSRPTVLVTIKGLGIGGAEKLISEGAKHWDRDRFDYHVAYVLPWKDQLVPDLEALGVPVTCLGGAKGRLPAAYRSLRRLVHRIEPSLVHAHSPVVGVMARYAGAPVVYTEHNVVDSYRWPTLWGNRLTYHRNRAVMAVSGQVAESLDGYRGPTPVVITNGVSVRVDPADAASARGELGLPDGAVLAIHVGNIRPHKGHSNLIAAAALLADRTPDVRIVSIGGEKQDGDLARVSAQAEAAGAAKILRFIGRRPDALSFVAAADLFVNPSDYEGLPVAVLEAMALGKAVVATSVGGVPSVIADGVDGVLVPPQDAEALAAAVEGLAGDLDRARLLGERAAALVDVRYSLPAMVRAVEAQYQAAIDG